MSANTSAGSEQCSSALHSPAAIDVAHCRCIIADAEDPAARGTCWTTVQLEKSDFLRPKKQHPIPPTTAPKNFLPLSASTQPSAYVSVSSYPLCRRRYLNISVSFFSVRSCLRMCPCFYVSAYLASPPWLALACRSTSNTLPYCVRESTVNSLAPPPEEHPRGCTAPCRARCDVLCPCDWP